jgi:ubiquinone/menaquinone biosynthesis C-methylase UbiE
VAARRVRPSGCLHAIAIEWRMIARVQHRARAAGERAPNIAARVASVYELPYPDDFFDVIYMITVTGEIPDPMRALREFRRVLKLAGTLAVSEIPVDPDYPWASTVTRWAAASLALAPRAGFGPRSERLKKPPPARADIVPPHLPGADDAVGQEQHQQNVDHADEERPAWSKDVV